MICDMSTAAFFRAWPADMAGVKGKTGPKPKAPEDRHKRVVTTLSPDEHRALKADGRTTKAILLAGLGL